MQLILINKSGEPSQFALTSLRVKMLGIVAVFFCVGLVSAGFVLKQSDFVDAAVIETWRSKLNEQDDVVEKLRAQSVVTTARNPERGIGLLHARNLWPADG